jgi:hypothetical protein
MVEGNITNQYPLTKIRNYYRMGDGILDGFPIIQDQTSPNLAHIPTTNLVTHSENFFPNGNFWTFQGVNQIDNSIISPDGTQNADKFYPSATGSFKGLTKHFGSSLNPTAYNLSAFVKKGGKDFFFFYNIGSPQGTNGCWFNLSTGVIGHIGGAYRNVKIENVGNDWFRCSATLNYGASNDYVYFLMSDSNNSNTSTVNGTDGIYLWGTQIEEQSQATAYIKSDGIAAVRKATTTNLIPYSEDFSNADNPATASNSVLTANQLDFNNTNNAYSLTENTSNSEHYVELASMSQTTNNTLTSSIYIKANGRTKVKLWNYYLSNQFAKVEFDLSNNTISNSGATNVTFVSANIEDYNTEWKRISITSVKTASNYDYKIRLNILDNSGSDSYVGDGTSGVFIYAAQMEEQTQAETYAKTTGLPVTIDLFTENNYGTMTNMSASDIVEDTPNN